MSKRILIIGGYGAFGSRLAKALVELPQFEVFVGGRNLSRAESFCAENGGSAFQLDLASSQFEADVTTLKPFLIVDAAGPFQSYGDDLYKAARTAITCDAHYLDFSDDAHFTKGIAALDPLAKAAGVSVLSGVSSVPALSSAVVTALSDGLIDIHKVESAILPGNRAPRGQSVVSAILSQVGHPLSIWRDGVFETAHGWSNLRALTLKAGDGSITNRWASLIGAPDLLLFPEYFGARSVLFRAGLELKLMHGGLSLIGWLVHCSLLRSATPLIPALKWIADRLEPFGSDRGGMLVSVAGISEYGEAEQRHWSLTVAAGDGPKIPTIPAQILLKKIQAGEVKAGARPSLNEFTLQEAEDALIELCVTTDRTKTDFPLAFREALGTDFQSLPQPIADLHTVIDVRRWSGRASVSRGRNLLSRIAGTIAGFPPAGDNIPITVEMRRRGETEVWIRNFVGNKFRSVLKAGGKPGSGLIHERFGLLNFHIRLTVEDGKLSYPVVGGSCLGLPLPHFLLPKSKTSEYVDEEGRACFDVSIELPIGGHVATYRGWLSPNEISMAS